MPIPRAREFRPAAAVVAAVALALMTVLAARADSSVAHPNIWTTALDLAVGLAFVAGARAALAPLAERGLIALVGIAWLAGSMVPLARPLHQVVLIIALLAFPRGRVEGWAAGVLVAIAALVALGLVTQIGVAAVFAAAAVTAAVRCRSNATLFPALAGAALAAGIVLDWLVTHQEVPDPTLGLVVYEVALLGVAVGFPLATRAVIRARIAMADQLLAEPMVPALDGLAAVLADAIGDATLQIYRWDGSGYVDGAGRSHTVPPDALGWLEVADVSGPVAAVSHRSTALQDPPTVEAVSSAVRLTVTHIRLQGTLQDRLREMEAARLRIVAATDRQRLQVAAELRKIVEPALRDARSELQTVLVASSGPVVTGSLDAVAHELSAASAMIAGLVAGVPPATLGDGRLSAAITELAATSPVRVDVTLAQGTTANHEVETAAYYVCSEALANVIKHARATAVQVNLHRVGECLVATIADDGCGGADPSGSGLQGLADRVAASAGRLRVESPPGVGTTITATIPVS
jgi:signal transduction histidine kinase